MPPACILCSSPCESQLGVDKQHGVATTYNSQLRRCAGTLRMCRVETLRTACLGRRRVAARAVDHENSQSAPELAESTSGRDEQTPLEQHSSKRLEPPGNLQLQYKLVAGFAAVGAAITGYLTLEKLTGGNVACPASGSCETILSSGYATILGLPLSLLGFSAYAAVGGLAAWQASQKQNSQLGRFGVLAGGLVLAATSANLLYLLVTQFPGQSCTWCVASAMLSFSIFFSACSGFKPRRELADLAAPGGLTAAGVTLFLALAWSGVEAPQAFANINLPYQPTIVRAPSSPRAKEVARQLRQAGARMFGAFWCSHCQEQKIAFGKDAQEDLPYVECFPEGYKSGVQMVEECKAANLQGFPLWIINGHRYEGEQTLSDLEAALKKAPAS